MAFSVETLASEARMSPSALHEHFKTVTGASPRQFQKHIRLLEARHLMLSQAMDVAAAAQTVGYESPSQFSREYRRLFGAPPVHDIAQLKAQWGNEFPDFVRSSPSDPPRHRKSEILRRLALRDTRAVSLREAR
jgi:AraC-like DNA-binding protein